MSFTMDFKLNQTSINFNNAAVQSAQYGMTPLNFNQFMSKHFIDVDEWIDKALKFIDTARDVDGYYDFGKHLEDIKIHCVSCLPFMMFDTEEFGKLENPMKETQESYQQSLQFLQYMKFSKGMAQYYLKDVIDDFKGINEEELDKAIDIQNRLQIKKELRNAKQWWGKKDSVIHLAWHLHLALDGHTEKICRFIGDFIFEMTGKQLEEDNIRKHIYYAATKGDEGHFVRANPHFFKENLI